jgi:hypothetical protein
MGFGSPDKIASRHRQIINRHGERQSCLALLDNVFGGKDIVILVGGFYLFQVTKV